MTDLVALQAANARRWANAKVTRSFSAVARLWLGVKAVLGK